MGKCPPIAAFCEFVVSLYTPHFSNLGAKLPIVSDLHLKYSRFLETCARDRARSTLRGGVGRRTLAFRSLAPSTQRAARGYSACEKPAQIHSFAEPRDE